MAQLTITPSSSNLGTITNDIQYTVTSDTAGTLTASIMVNDAIFAQQSLTSGTSSSILITQLPTGENTITLTATLTESGGGTTTQTATWQYTKTPIAFPTAGSVADLSVNGQTVLPTTLAEAVRTSPVWGGSLDLALQELSSAALYKTDEPTPGLYDIQNNLLLSLPGSGGTGFVQIETGSYTGTGTYGKSNPNSLTFGFEPNILIVTGVGGSATKYQDIGFFIRNAERSFGTGAGQLSIYYNGGLDSSANVVTWNGKTVSWYSPSASNQASIQLNNRRTYNYVAFG